MMPQDRKKVPKEQVEGIDNSLELKLISIRLNRILLADFKLMAAAKGINYQTLMREVLSNYIADEYRKEGRMAMARFAEKQAKKALEGKAK